MRLNTFLGVTGMLPYPSRLAPLHGQDADAMVPTDGEKGAGAHMPLSSIGSYAPTTQAFITHWQTVNTQLGAPANAMVLPGPYPVASLQADRDALAEALTAVEAADNAYQQAAAGRDAKKAAISQRLLHYRAAVVAVVQDVGFVDSLPKLPKPTQAETYFLKPFRDMVTSWRSINAATGIPGFTAPLLVGSLTLADYEGELGALVVEYTAAQSARQLARQARKSRDVICARIKNKLKVYRTFVIAKLGPSDPLVATIPVLSPPEGATPDPVALSGSWDAEAQKLCLAWTASPNTHLAHYSLRMCAGGGYTAAEEMSVALIPKEETTALTDAGLSAPGSHAEFRVYVVLDTGNERGSNTLKCTRPGL